MNDHDRQKMKEMMKRAFDLNRALLEELDQLLIENKTLEEENKKWREHYEVGSHLYRKNQPTGSRS